MNNSTLPEHERWREHAECAGLSRDNYDIFFPNSRGIGMTHLYKAAAALCAECPVRAECEQYARDNHISFGVWGGTSPEGRGMTTKDKLGMQAIDVGASSEGMSPARSWRDIPRDPELYDYTFSKTDLEATAAARKRRAAILARVDAELGEDDKQCLAPEQRQTERFSTHGLSRYVHLGCRCRLCVNAYNEYQRDRLRRIRDGTWRPDAMPLPGVPPRR